MRKIENICILAKGEWEARCLKIRQVANLSNVSQDNVVHEIEEKWKEFKESREKVGKKAEDNPTFCYLSHKQTKDELLLNVLSSTYKSSLVLGYIGCAMIPVTSDNHIVLVKPSPERERFFGSGIASAGCTPHCIQVVEHVCIEMEEEFGVSVEKKDLRILGLTQIYDAVLVPNHCLVFGIKTNCNQNDFQGLWAKAKDADEAKCLCFIETAKIVPGLPALDCSAFNPHTLVDLEMLAESGFHMKND